MTVMLPMTPARRAVLALGVPVVLAVIGWTAFSAVAFADQVSYRVHLSVPASAGGVSVSAGDADATVRPGRGNRIRVSGTLRGSLARPVFSWRSTAAGLALDSRCRVPAGVCSGGFTITAPSGLPVAVSGSSGDLNASGFRGHVTLSDGSGDLGASQLSGTISLAAGSGDIAASRLNGGGVRLSDGSGDIAASGLHGSSVRLSDGSGDIVVTGLAGTGVVAIEGSGDITLTFTKVPRRVDVTDQSGDITLVLPRGPTYYHVVASSSSGDTSVSVLRRNSSPYVITANDGSGDISIGY